MLGKINYVDGGGVFESHHENGTTIKQNFTVINLQQGSLLEIECFTEFGSAKSPYIAGELTSALEITDSLMAHKDSSPGYVESIMLHEMLDKDDGDESMLEAEKFVVQKIQELDDLNDDQKNDLLQKHIGFFEGNKKFYEKQFSAYEAYYKKNPNEYENAYKHYQKICAVVAYLTSVMI